MKRILQIFALATSCFNLCFSQPGRLDPTFGNNGIVRTDLGTKYNYNFDNSSIGKQVLLLPDGCLFVLVNSSILNGTVITKRLPNGEGDIKFGNKGFSPSVPLNDPRAALQADGKVVIVGWSFKNSTTAVSLARYNKDGSRDSTFVSNEKEIIDFGTTLSVAIQKDGKIVVAGSVIKDENTFFAMARYNKDGKLDKTFGKDGKQIVDFGLALPGDRGGTYPEFDFATSLAIADRGNIIVAGYAYNYKTFTNDFAVARFTSSGLPDSTFDKDGKKTTDFLSSDDYANTVAVQADGKIVLAGYSNSDYAVARYNADGSIDKTFSGDGKQITDLGSPNDIAYAVAVKSDGKIVLAGITGDDSNKDIALVSYNKNGSLDNTFSQDGKQITDLGTPENIANSLVIQKDGKIVVGGYRANGNHSDFTLVRYNIDGSIDNSFNGKGKLNDIPKQGYTDYNSTAVQKDGKIVAVGQTWNGKNFDFVVARYNTDGNLDKTFSDDGIKLTDFASSDDEATAVAIQPDGKIVVAGTSHLDFAIARYNADGTPDKAFNNTGKQITDFASSDDKATSIAIQRDGKIVVVGTSNLDFALVRYTTNGTLDKDFSRDGKQVNDFGSSEDYAYSVAIAKNGRIVVAGTTVVYIDGYSSSNIAVAAYNSNGNLDNSFDNDGRQTTTFGDTYNFGYSVAVQNDDKIVVAGSTGGPSLFAVVRYNKNGSIDKSFSDDGMQTTAFNFDNSIPKSVAIQDNGKIVLGGYVLKDNHVSFCLARYSTDGKLDKTFSEDGIQITEASEGDNFINGLAVANNKLYVVGTGRYPGDLGVLARYLLEENKAPVVHLSTPENIVNYTTASTIKLIATARDEDGAISKVLFYRGNTLVHTENLVPYGYSLKNLSAGTYTFYAKAIDNSGNETKSNTISITVKDCNTKPIVSLISPKINMSYSGPATINLIAEAKAPNDKISKVEFYNGGTLLATEKYYPYTYVWSNVQPGTYIITAVATDDKGLSTTSAPVKVAVEKATMTTRRPLLENIETGNNNLMSLRLSPNPTSNVLQISTTGFQTNKPLSISIISSAGGILKNVSSNTSTKVVQVDVSSMANGVYTVKVMSEGRIAFKQFVKL